MENEKERASSLAPGKARGRTVDDDKAARKFEEDCIMRCHDGDRDAFSPLVERYSKSLFMFVFRMVDNEEDAKEITQEVFTRAFKNLIDFNLKYRFSTWLYTIALNLCRDHMRQARKAGLMRRINIDMKDVKSIDPVEERIDTKRQHARLMTCMQHLPDKYREVIVMKDVMMLSYRQIQQSLHLPIPVLKVRVMRARKKMCLLMNSMQEGEKRQ